MNHTKKRSGFSLVEVVVSVGIFAVAIVGIIGLFAPTTKNVAAVADADGSNRAVAAIQSALKESGFTAVKSSFSKGYIYYANKNGTVVDQIKTDGSLNQVVTSNVDRFFEFSLTRNGDSPNVGDGLSPAANDNTAGFLAFTINLRWPAYLPNGVPVTDNSQKSTLIVPAAVTR